MLEDGEICHRKFSNKWASDRRCAWFSQLSTFSARAKNAIDVRVCCQLRHHLRHDFVTSLVTGETGLQGDRVLICSCDVGSHTQLKYEGGGRFRGSHIPSSGSSGRSSQVSRLG